MQWSRDWYLDKLEIRLTPALCHVKRLSGTNFAAFYFAPAGSARKVFQCPPWNFLTQLQNLSLGKMVHFRALPPLGYLPSVNDCNLMEDLGVSDSIAISS